jgi:DNA-binding transcriptional LysR family regulator
MTSSSAPDLIALELLDSIAELGSLGRAATRHGMSQPAVSQRMTQLERVLGIRLLRRSRAGTTLTPAGEQVAVMARRVLREMRALMAGVTALAAEEDARLRVAASLTVAEYLLPGWLSALRQESPDVILAVAVSNSSQVLTQVRDGSADARRARRSHRAQRPARGGGASRPSVGAAREPGDRSRTRRR